MLNQTWRGVNPWKEKGMNIATRSEQRSRVLALTAASLALFVIFLDNTIVNVALPAIQRDLASAPDSLEWVVSAYIVTFAGLVLLGGKLGDRYGHRRMFLTGLLVFTAASAAGALATTDEALVAARAGQGVGAALLAPLSLSLLAGAFPAGQLPAAIGVWAGISGLGLAIGPLAGGLLVAHSGWHAVFWATVPVTVAAAVAAVGTPGSGERRRAPLNLPAAALVTAGLIGTTAGLIRTVAHPWSDPVTVTLLAAGTALIAAFVLLQRRSRSPLLPPGLIRAARFRTAAVVVALASFALLGALWFLSLYLQNVDGYSAVQAGIRTLPLTVTTLFVAPVAGRVAARRGPLPVLTAGLLLTAAAFVGLAQVEAATGYGYLAAALLALGAGLALVLPTAVSILLTGVAADSLGVASGVATMSRQVGGALGLAVLGTLGGRLAASSFSATVGDPPTALAQLAAGGQVTLIGRIAGQSVADAATTAFLHGFDATMWAAAAVTMLALLAAGPLLRHRHRSAPAHHRPVPVTSAATAERGGAGNRKTPPWSPSTR
jgi:EmrB/QacA subfamily drug resistance transporter